MSQNQQPSLVDEVPKEFQEIFQEIVALTDRFCDKYLDDEFKHICREMAFNVCQAGSPVARGKRESWACGIVYSVGWVNFFSDPGLKPHVRSEEIAKEFGVSEATMHNKAKVIREGLGLTKFDPDFTVPSRLEINPLVWMVQVNGMIVDVRDAPREVQQMAYEQGVIPFIPGETGESFFEEEEPRGGDAMDPQPNPDLILQFKITLKGIKPPIWRRIQIPDCTLDLLHDYIQAAFGWEDCHLHEFEIQGRQFRGPGPMGFDMGMDDDVEDAEDFVLSELMPKTKPKKPFKFQYEYDFGDGWEHEIVFEGFVEKKPGQTYPLCVAGKRACPPEDVGGPWGYADFLEAISDPEHDQHEDMIEWGGEFDPEEFDSQEATQAMQYYTS